MLAAACWAVDGARPGPVGVVRGTAVVTELLGLAEGAAPEDVPGAPVVERDGLLAPELDAVRRSLLATGRR